MMEKINEILHSEGKPKVKQTRLVQAVMSGEIPVEEFITFFESAKDVEKGNCADVIKHISVERPDILAPYIDILIRHINDPLPRVKWGIPEAIGNLAKNYPEKVADAIPYLLQNTTNNNKNTTVIKWCAAYALGEISKHNPTTRPELIPLFSEKIHQETNSGVRNVYIKALKAIEKK